MDEYGLMAAARAGLAIFEAASRHSGRTETMLAQLKDGDWIVACPASEADRLRRECARRKLKDIRVIGVDPADPHSFFQRVQGFDRSRGCRIFFDHNFQRAFIEARLQNCERELDGLLERFRDREDSETIHQMRGRHLRHQWVP